MLVVAVPRISEHVWFIGKSRVYSHRNNAVKCLYFLIKCYFLSDV
jgi:hypothetical protein